MRSRLGLARAGAVVGASAAALMLTALPANAGQAKGELNGNDTAGYPVNLESRGGLSTKLMSLELGGGETLRVYCVEIDEEVDRDRTMVEHDWDGYPNPDSPFHNKQNRQKINWVLHNAYPVAGVDKLEKALGGKVDLNKREAITATQAAIWHYSDAEKLNRKDPVAKGDAQTDADVLALYDYLTGEANTGMTKQPTPALKIKPAEAKGKVGEPIGPIKVITNGEITGVTEKFPEGVTLTDAEGNSLDLEAIQNGTEFYLHVPADAADGSASYSVTVSTEVATGRLFVAKNYGDKPAQSLIVASSERTKLTDKGTVSWTASPGETTPPETTTPPVTETTAPPATSETAPVAPSSTDNNVSNADTDNLAYTGASVVTPLLIGVALLGVGALALILVRRRKKV